MTLKDQINIDDWIKSSIFIQLSQFQVLMDFFHKLSKIKSVEKCPKA
jgi:hypothetical protein